MKKLCTIFAALTLVVLCFVLMPAEAEAASTSDLIFQLNSDGQSYYVADCEESASGSLTIPSTYNGKPVTSIGDRAFSDCYSLTSVTIPDSVTSIGRSAFSHCDSLTSVTIPDSVTSIGMYAFSYCDSLTSVTIPDSVTSIGSSAFQDCDSLTSVTIPDSVASIGWYVFSYCDSLTSVTIGDSVTSIGEYAFYNCTSLTKIQVDVKNPNYSSDAQGVLYNKAKTVLIQAPGAITSCMIPSGVTGIGNYAFYNCTSLTSVTIGDSVTSIGNYAFSGCDSLTKIQVDAKNPNYSSDAQGILYNKNKTVLIWAPGVITSCIIPSGVTSIGDNAFYNCDSLTSVTIPDSVTSIGEYAFYNCDSLTSVTIPDSVTSIGRSAFYNCTSLTSVTYCGTEEQWNQITIGSSNTYLLNAKRSYHNYIDGECIYCGTTCNIAYGICTVCNNHGTCGANLTWTLDTEGTLTVSGTGDMSDYSTCGAPWYSLRSSIKAVVISDGVTGIGDNAFYGCTALTDVTIGADVKRIADEAFRACENLKRVYISDMAAWCDISFGYYSDLYIGMNFSVTEYCGNPLYNGADLYLNGKLVTDLVIPEGVTTISDHAFYHYEKLTSVTIPGSVTKIGEAAFAKCTNLLAVTYCGTPEQWDQIDINMDTDGTGLLYDGNQELLAAKRSYHNWSDADCITKMVCTICGEVGDYGHTWVDATCTSAKFCFACGKVEGKPLGHNWQVSCTAPKTCATCGKIEGSAPGHAWAAATCTAPKTCTACGIVEGTALGHSWVAATCTAPKTCTTCGATEGSVQHSWNAATCVTPQTCKLCGITQGSALGHRWADATCQKPKTCTVCGITAGGLADHAYDNELDNACNVCGAIRVPKDSSLKFYGTPGLSFQEYIGMQILAKNEILSTYDKVYVGISQITPEGVAKNQTIGMPYAGKYTVFEQQIVSWSMTETVTMTLYGEKNGIVYEGASFTTTVKELAMIKLATYKEQGDMARCKALVDMLNYGAAVQSAYDYNANDLANADLGEYAELGTQDVPGITAENNITGTNQIKVYSDNISLQDKVEFQFMVKTSALNGKTVVATLNGDAQDVVYEKYNSYTIIRVAAAAAHMRDTYTIVINDANGNPVTATYNVSVEAYAKEQLNTDRASALIAMMRYGDSVAAID